MNQSQMFFPTSKTKLIIMSVCTFGIYIFYWFYENWKISKKTQSLDIRPFWRTFFVPIFCYSLFKGVRECANEKNVRAEYSLCWLTVGFIFLVIVLTPLAVFPLLPVQNVINFLNAEMNPNLKINDQFNGWNIAGIIFGVVFWGLLILSMTMPVPST